MQAPTEYRRDTDVMQTVETVTHLGLGRTATGELIARTLPGEEVEVTDDGIRILTPSPQRVAAPCRHFKSCGGCAMQHASDDFVAGWKAGIVRKALENQGLAGEIAGVETSPPGSRRRAKLSGRKTKGGALVGFHARASDQIVAVPECKLLSPALLATLPALERLTQMAASRSAEVGLTVTQSLAGPDISVETDRPLTRELREEIARWAEDNRIARLVWAGEQVAMRAPPVQRFGRADVVPPPGAFLQATPQGEAALLAQVQRITAGARRIADLFAGCGTFALPLSERAEVHAVEGDAAMLAALDRGWRQAGGLSRITTEARDLFRRPLLPDELARFDAVVLDPPRAGAEAQVTEIARSSVRTVAMVSCNPVTFARDARLLTAAGFALQPVTVVDQFRWSPHIEIVAAFTRT